jgi:hypothetical protein
VRPTILALLFVSLCTAEPWRTPRKATAAAACAAHAADGWITYSAFQRFPGRLHEANPIYRSGSGVSTWRLVTFKGVMCALGWIGPKIIRTKDERATDRMWTAINSGTVGITGAATVHNARVLSKLEK